MPYRPPLSAHRMLLRRTQRICHPHLYPILCFVRTSAVVTTSPAYFAGLALLRPSFIENDKRHERATKKYSSGLPA
jgi:hypothetical protein